MNILADSTLLGLDEAFPAPFKLTRYNSPEEIKGLLANQEVLLCRSTLKVNQTLLNHHQLHYVATASSGTDHLDHDFLNSQSISIIDAKGCNATSVADYITSCLAYLNQKQLIKGSIAGVIGMGQVGSQVEKRLRALNFNIVSYDPLKSKQEATFNSCELEHLFKADLLCIHAELHHHFPYPSANLIGMHFLEQLKPGCVIINAARGGIVDEEALLNNKQSITYCTDVYLNEPQINKRVIDKSVLCTPHIAGHSLEAKFAAVALVSEKLHRIAGLPPPQFAKPALAKPLTILTNLPWEDQVLSIYNPLEETLQLKQATDKKSAFLKLRKKHNIRHDFSTYFNSISVHETIKMAQLIGI